MAMKQIRGFRIRLKLVKAIKWVIHERKTHARYTKLKPTNCTDKAIARLCKLGRTLNRSLKELCCRKSGSGYVRVRLKKPVPRGHLAVYFGEEEDEARRVLVPVFYFNHPFFGDLLREFMGLIIVVEYTCHVECRSLRMYKPGFAPPPPAEEAGMAVHGGAGCDS